MEYLVAFLFVLGVMLVIGAIAYLTHIAEKKRTEAWRVAAAELGFEFKASGGNSILSRYPGFHLFSQGRNHTVKNLLLGKTTDLDVAIFDYSYTTGSGKNRRTWHQTVVAF